MLHILLNSEKLLAEIKIAQAKQRISVCEHSQKNTPYIEKRSPYETTFVLHYSQMPIFFVKHQLLRLHSCAGKIISIYIKRRKIVRSEKKCKRKWAYKRSLQTQTSHTKSGLHKQTAFIISAYLIKCRKICHPLHKAQDFSRSTNFCSLHSSAGKIISICISRREIVCSEKKCKRSGVYFAYAGTEPMQSPLHKKHKSGLYKPLCFSAYSIRRRIFREVRVSEQMRECAYSAYAIERICDRNDVIRGKDKPYYSMIPATTPDPTVRPPSRIANLSPSSIAIGVIRLIVIVMLSPGMHISTPSGS